MACLPCGYMLPLTASESFSTQGFKESTINQSSPNRRTYLVIFRCVSSLTPPSVMLCCSWHTVAFSLTHVSDAFIKGHLTTRLSPVIFFGVQTSLCTESLFWRLQPTGRSWWFPNLAAHQNYRRHLFKI